MIKIDMFLAVGMYFSFLFVFFWAALYSRERASRADDFDVNADLTKYVRQCPYCGHVGIDYNRRQIFRCSVCSSYMEDKGNVE